MLLRSTRKGCGDRRKRLGWKRKKEVWGKLSIERKGKEEHSPPVKIPRLLQTPHSQIPTRLFSDTNTHSGKPESSQGFVGPESFL